MAQATQIKKPPAILDEIPDTPPEVLDEIPDDPPAILDEMPDQPTKAITAEVKKNRFINRDVNPLSIPVNAGKDLGDLVSGLAGLVGGAVSLPIKGAMRLANKEPLVQQGDIETVKSMPSALWEGIKEDYGQSQGLSLQGLAESFVAHPLNRFLDLATLGAGRLATSPKYSNMLLKNLGQRALETAPAKAVIDTVDNSWLRPLTDIGADFAGIKPESRLLGQQGSNVRKTKLIEQANQIKNITERNKAIAANKELFGNITDAEGKQLVQAVERGEIIPESLKTVQQNLKQKVTENADFYKNQGLLSEQQIMETPINQFAALKTGKRIDELTPIDKIEALKEIKNLPAEQQPFYIPIMYDDKLRSGSFFSDTTKRFKPNELKQRRKGGDFEGRVYSPLELSSRLDSHRIKMVNTENLINDITGNFAKPYKLGDELEPGYVAFNPDSFLSFYKKSIDLNDMTMAKLDELQNVDSALKASLDRSIAELPDDIQNFIAVSKRRNIYQIPKEVADTLGYGKWKNTPLEMLFDTATGMFKRKVLGLSPKWFINNRIGNGIMASMQGVTPDYLVKALNTSEDLLPEALKTNSMYEAEKAIIGRAGGGEKGATSSLVRLLAGEFIDTTELKGLKKAGVMTANIAGIPGNIIGKITDKMFSFNQWFEGAERKATYLKGVDKIGKIMLKNTGQKIAGQEALLNAVKNNPNVLNKVLEFTDNTLGDYINLTPVERRILRRAVPFYSWTRTISRYVLNLPETSPIKTNITQKLTEVLQEDESTPEYQKGSVGLGIKNQKTGKDLVLNYRRSIPFETFGSVGDNPLSSLNPIIQQGITSGLGRKVFTGDPLTSPNYTADFGGRYFNNKTRYYEDLPVSEKAISYPLGIARNMIPLAPETEKLLTGALRGRIPDELWDTSLGGYNYDEIYKKPKGMPPTLQLIKNLLPIQEKQQRRKKK